MKIASVLAPKALPSTHKCLGHCIDTTTCDGIAVLWGPKLKLFWHTTGPKSARLSACFSSHVEPMAKAQAIMAHHRPQKWWTIRPFFASHVVPTLLCFEKGGESSSFGGYGV